MRLEREDLIGWGVIFDNVNTSAESAALPDNVPPTTILKKVDRLSMSNTQNIRHSISGYCKYTYIVLYFFFYYLLRLE